MNSQDFRAWLRTLADAQATVPAAEVIKRLPEGASQPFVGGDMTLTQVAEEVGRATSTVRGWCNSGRLDGAYRLNGRDWRIPTMALRRFLDDQNRSGPRLEVHDGNWDSWRDAG